MSFQSCKIVGVGVDSESYHQQDAERGTAEFIMSPSSIKAFAQCPSRWKNSYRSPDSDSKDFGSLFDCVVLTPHQFKDRYIIKPLTYPDSKTGEPKPWNGNATFCRDWAENQAGKSIVSENDVREAQTAAKRLMSDETIAELLNCSDKQVHVKGQWKDKATGLLIPVQCLIDFAPKSDSPFQKSLGDIKTTRNASQKPFSRFCYQMGYHLQAAFDLALYGAATGQDRSDWLFVLLENYQPYETGRRLLSQDFIEIGKNSYQHALAQYAKCVQTGIWTGYDKPEEFSLVQADPWMAFEAVSESMEADQNEASDEIGDDLNATA